MVLIPQSLFRDALKSFRAGLSNCQGMETPVLVDYYMSDSFLRELRILVGEYEAHEINFSEFQRFLLPPPFFHSNRFDAADFAQAFFDREFWITQNKSIYEIVSSTLTSRETKVKWIRESLIDYIKDIC